MKNGFTLIELIFVIVIIGLLSAVAVPKFLKLKQNAQSSTLIKTTVDGAQSAVETAINYQDLDGNSSFALKDILSLRGKGWQYDDGTSNGRYHYDDNGNTVAEINLSIGSREVNYSINCKNFADSSTQDKCSKILGSDSVSQVLKY